MKIFLITVGTLKDRNLQLIENEYLKRIKTPFEIIELKSFGEDLNKEGQAVVQKVLDLSSKKKSKVILLTENAKQLDSPSFSKWLFLNVEEVSGPIFFIIGGAKGHGKAVYDIMSESISLGSLTYPHKLARILLVEQIYRAETIKNNHPYHK